MKASKKSLKMPSEAQTKHVLALFLDSNVPKKIKTLGVLFIVAALGYTLSPIDLSILYGLPDIVPLLGWIDDGMSLILAVKIFEGLANQARLARLDTIEADYRVVQKQEVER